MEGQVLLNLLEELKEFKYWFDGSGRMVLYCVQYKDLRSIDSIDSISLNIKSEQTFNLF